VALSGAGPTMLALVDRRSSRKAELEAFMRGTLKEEGIEASTMWLSPDRAGVQAHRLTSADSGRTLFEMIKGENRA
ncbi:homoserine kinase, partial [Paenibacillus ehimensis]|nr:homoserine kinase [Paenibacillus ehimensis]